MKILYISAHSILEHDELEILTSLGHEVFSLGAYLNPEGHAQLPRPGIKGMPYWPDLEKQAREFPKTNIPQEFLDNFDLYIFMHNPEALVENWPKLKGRRVILRTIGQNTPEVENAIRPLRAEGLKIIRMSPMEQNITGYVGGDAMIRFGKDPNEWQGYNGRESRVINMTQSLKGRRIHCHFDSIMSILNSFPALVYGTGNEDLYGLNGGELPYELMKGALRDNRAFVYGGTWPSPYTLAFIEPWMTGIPMICLGQHLAEDLQEIPQNSRINYYEIPSLIRNGENGFVSDSINDLRSAVQTLLDDPKLAEKIGEEGRRDAIKLFGVEKIKDEWRNFLGLI